MRLVSNIITSVSVTNFPGTTEITNDTGSPIPVSGSVTVANPTANPETGLAKEATLGRRFGGSKLSYAANLTTTTDITPTPGTSIRVLWVAFVPNPDNSSANLVTISFVGGSAMYTGYALAHWERFDGTVDQKVRITLANNQPVAVTVHYEEY